jgi:hypothetical protein
LAGKHSYSWEGTTLETYLAIIQDLNGVENLPALLSLEKALNGVALYDIPNQGRAFEHPQVLSVITLILSNEEAPDLGSLHVPGVYERAYRDQIIQLARHFLEVTPPDRFRGAAGMSEQFKYR